MTNRNDLEFDNNVLNFKLQLKTARVTGLERQVHELQRLLTDKAVALATQTARADRLDHCLNVANQGLDNLLGNYFGESTDRLDVIDDLPPDLS